MMWLLLTGTLLAGARPAPAGPPATQARAGIQVRRGGDYYSFGGFVDRGHVLAAVNHAVPLGLQSEWKPRTGEIILRHSNRDGNWRLVMRVGSRTARLNGYRVAVPIAPRFVPRSAAGELGEYAEGPLIPLGWVARLRGYRTGGEFSRESSGWQFILSAPDSYTPTIAFRDQRVIEPARRSVDGLDLRADLSFGQTSVADVPMDNVLVTVTVTNHRVREYVGSDNFLFVEMADGSVLAGDQETGSYSARALRVSMPAGASGTVKAAWLVRADRHVPIRRIIYSDGVRTVTWTVAGGTRDPQ